MSTDSRTVHNFGPVLARVHRDVVTGEHVSTHLELIGDDETVELHEGEEFVTVMLAVEPASLLPA